MASRSKGIRLTANNSSANRGARVWTDIEDNKLRQLVEKYGTSKWKVVAGYLVDRSGKQCRERFHNHLQQGIQVGDWTLEEDRAIFILRSHLGNQWSKIARVLPGRTDNSVKNRFHFLERAHKRGEFDISFLRNSVLVQKVLEEELKQNATSNTAVCGENSRSSRYKRRMEQLENFPEPAAMPRNVRVCKSSQSSDSLILNSNDTSRAVTPVQIYYHSVPTSSSSLSSSTSSSSSSSLSSTICAALPADLTSFALKENNLLKFHSPLLYIPTSLLQNLDRSVLLIDSLPKNSASQGRSLNLESEMDDLSDGLQYAGPAEIVASFDDDLMSEILVGADMSSWVERERGIIASVDEISDLPYM